MATSLVVNGVSYLYPDTGDQSWGTVASSWAAAVTTGMLQKSGGTFTLTADVNFGASFGILSKYFTSKTANAAASGVIRLADTEAVAWRNHANGADISLSKDTSDNLTWAGNIIANSSGIVPVGGGGTGLPSGTSGGILGYTGTTTLASSALLTASQLIIGGGAGATPSTLAAGTQYQVLVMGASNPGYGQVNLAQSAAVTGVLPNANTTAASTNTVSTIVLRDGSGNFSAGTITASLTGTASTATNATNTAITDDTTTNATMYPTWVTANTGNLPQKTTSTKLSFNPSTGTLTSTIFSGSGASLTSLNASNLSSGTVPAAQMPALTGDVTTSAGAVATTIAANAVTNAKAAQMATNTIKGNNTGGTANAADLTVSQVTALLGVTTGSTVSSLAERDVNANLSANNVLLGYAPTTTAAGTTTLFVSDKNIQVFTGATTQTVVLPVTSTLVQGHEFTIINLSSGVVTVQSSGANTIQAMAANTQLVVTCISTSGTGTSSWTWVYSAVQGTLGGTGTVTSVGVAVPNTMSSSGGPVTTSGTITLANTALAAKTANYTLTTTDYVVTFNPSNSTVTATLPTAVSASGTVYRIKNIGTGTGQVNIATTSAQTVDGRAMSGATQIILAYQNTYIDVVSDGANWVTLASGEIITASYYKSTSGAPGANTQINYDTKVFDSHAAVTTGAGAWKFTAPAAGLYLVNFTIMQGASTSTDYQVYKNGSVYSQPVSINVANFSYSASALLLLAAADTVDVRPTSAVSVNGNTTTTYINIHRVNSS